MAWRQTCGETLFRLSDGQLRAASWVYFVRRHSIASRLSLPPRMLGREGLRADRGVPVARRLPSLPLLDGAGCNAVFCLSRDSARGHRFPARDLGNSAQLLGVPQTSLDREQEEGSIATSYPGGTIRYRKQGIHLFSVENSIGFRTWRLLGTQDPLAMQGMGGLFQSHVSEERVDGPQPGVPRASTVFASGFQVIEEETNERASRSWIRIGKGILPSLSLANCRSRRKQSRYPATYADSLPLAKQAIGEKRLRSEESWQ